VFVLTEAGKNVKDVEIHCDKAVQKTDVNGVAKFDDLDERSYDTALHALKKDDEKIYEFPAVSAKQADAKNGTVTQVIFVLPLKAKLKVELVPIDFNDLPKAEVILCEVTNRATRESKNPTVIEKKEHAAGKADFGTKPARSYRVIVKIDKKDEKHYGASDVFFELYPQEDKLVKIEIHRYFKKVRFIGLCLSTVPRPIWTGPDTKSVDDYRVTSTQNGEQPPAANAAAQEHSKHLNDYWGETKGVDSWKSRYNGPRSDSLDIAMRVDFLRKAMEKASEKAAPTDDTELKVFVAPECYFLGRYGAYPHHMFGRLIQQLQELVEDTKWRSWVFAFGTVNGFYMLERKPGEELTEMFNVSPVIRGGWKGGDPGLYTRLMQKSAFSAEIPKKSDLQPHDKADLDRPQITEDDARKDFHATQNEQLLGAKIEEIVRDIQQSDALRSEVKAKSQRTWLPSRWDNVKTYAEGEMARLGKTQFARQIRDDAVAHTAGKVVAPPEKVDLLDLLSLDVYLVKDMRDKVLKTKGGESFSFHDYCITGLRLPGPWFDDVDVGDKATRHTRVTFAVEICADHTNTRVAGSMQSLDKSELPDIHIVPSAGMSLKTVCAVENGFAFNCDGWNGPGFADSITKRDANVVFDLDERLPRKSGSNPLTPHTELAQSVNGQPQFINGGATKVDITEDASAIFSYRSLAERELYARDMRDQELRLSERMVNDLGPFITQQETALAKIDADIVVKESEIANCAEPKKLPGLNRQKNTLVTDKTNTQSSLTQLRALHQQYQDTIVRLRAQTTFAAGPARAGQIHIYPSKDLPTAY
jgi:hypothetical protein